MGQREGFSYGDAMKLNQMYQCSTQTPNNNRRTYTSSPYELNSINGGNGNQVIESGGNAANILQQLISLFYPRNTGASSGYGFSQSPWY